MKTKIVAVGAARTPIGSFGGTLRDVPVYDLGAVAIAGALARSGVDGAAVDKVIYANCRQAGNGPNPARTAAIRGGMPIAAPVMTVNMACPSGMKTVMLASRELQAGDARFVMAGGMESMSTMPYLLKGARWEGLRSGDKTLMDSWSDTIDPLCGYGMGITAENQAEKYGIGRAAQDAFAAQSQAKARVAQEAGWFDGEIVPVRLAASKTCPEGRLFSKDEGWRADSTVERLALLRPVFKADGTVTAGNACTMGDAASAIVLSTDEHAAAHGLKPLFSIVSFAETAVAPSLMGDGPSVSMALALQRAGMTLADMDFIEVNEAFAAQVLANEQALGWDRERLNVWGGAIALGHPTGFSGARLLMTLSNILRQRDKEWGIAAICGGGGVTTAMVIRREA
ncbi:thiolase family protein [Janthinobacterium sp. PC23-8]|uniref:thiolase family protein n=1 Tax=Janthinobacterium sp. PC23-8 TaxID=2012679 RepID=UPI000B9789AE|nr:thiolase family protein [Janthinobacterium sp. PC23-8]OYO26336.1 acetyl-CoA acetyltransferase [Janthinobacterium sp. PC23-8]